MRSSDDTEAAERDGRWLAAVMHVAFFVLLGSSLTRYLIVHPGAPATPWVIVLAAALALLYLLGPVLGRVQDPGSRRAAATSGLWLAAVVGVWLALVFLAPSFAYCAVPLFFIGLRSLGTRPALLLVALITAAVIAAQLKLRLRFGFDPNFVLAPPAIAAAATAVFLHSQRQAARLRAVIADLVRTRRELAATERREGTLAERQRLSAEIHDTLAQGMSSQQMLLQAADRLWDTDPDAARGHMRTAAAIAERNLAESRRFVHDLAPADLADGGSLDAALRALAERETTATLQVRFHQDGTPAAPLPERVQSALLRIAQGALANVREHADAANAAVTLTHLDGEVVLDIADDGRGFTPRERSDDRAGDSVRGHGLPAIRARVEQLGGKLTIESEPGEGTVLSAAVPLTDPN
ncbi:sensor histidine kinase [Yinghuangia soli]|uniref:Oxygen sensor histidine kinase NreB n=1 Tax=Yinghuangia soli TaxID=2908204 RepID=A0AA41Q2F3_9ACTN|nr:sensor histidine kinase [Yinghuangia soli]MCF2530333.1 sensor histidine kinase [Yinghuangia soli]